MMTIAARHLSTGLIVVTTILFTGHVAFGADLRQAAASRQSPPAATVRTFDSPQQAADAVGAIHVPRHAVLECL